MFSRAYLAFVVCLVLSLHSPATSEASMRFGDASLSLATQGEPQRSQAARIRPAERRLHALWNGFLDQTNILELGNATGSPIAVLVELFQIDGTLGTRQLVPIAGDQQRDIIVNNLAGFSRDSYGVIRLSFLSGYFDSSKDPFQASSYAFEALSDIVDARMSFYRSGAKSGTYDFAFSLPLLAQDQIGTTSVVTFNTFQPSTDPTESANVVANWLTIVNLRPRSKVFEIESYNFDGSPLIQRTIELPPFGRRDVEAGHENPGPSRVGMHLVRTVATGEGELDEEGDGYLVQLTRYGYRVDGTIAFAFPLQAVSTDNRYGGISDIEDLIVPLSTTLSGQNWLELANAEDTASSVHVDILDAAGTVKYSQSVPLAAHAQSHVNINAILGENQTGHAVLSKIPLRGDFNGRKIIVAQSMHYFRNSSGGIDSIYGAEALPVTEGYISNSGSYNLFLGMRNWLRIFNWADDPAEFSVLVYRPGQDEPVSQDVTVPARGSVNVPIHDSQAFSTQPDTYGVVRVSPLGWLVGSERQFFGPYGYATQLLRVRPAEGKAVDFVAPIPVSSVAGGQF